MNPQNTFLSALKTSFIDPFTKKRPFYPTPTGGPVAYGPAPVIGPMPIRNDLQANNAYPSAPANNEARGINYTPSNTGATGTNPVVIAPPKVTLPPAGREFVSNLANPPAAGAPTGSVPGPNGTNTSPGGETPVADTVAPPQAKESPYLTYLRSLFDPNELSSAFSNVQNANKRLGDIQSESERLAVSGRHQIDDLLSGRKGGLLGGVNLETAGISRRTNSELADLAVQESAAARTAGVYKDTYDTLIGAGKSVFEAETAAAKAATDQANEDRSFKLEQEKADQAKLAADRTFEENKRQFGLQYALDEKKYNLDALKVANDNPNSPAALSAKDAEASSSMNLINQLIANKDLGAIFGSVGQYKPSLILGSGGNLALNQFNQVKGQLALENRSKLKGQGAVSDFEGRVLDSAASALGRNLSDADGVKQLKQIRGAIATSHGLPADVLVRDPRTNESQVVSADSASIAAMVKDGLLVEYQ